MHIVFIHTEDIFCLVRIFDKEQKIPKSKYLIPFCFFLIAEHLLTWINEPEMNYMGF